MTGETDAGTGRFVTYHAKEDEPMDGDLPFLKDDGMTEIEEQAPSAPQVEESPKGEPAQTEQAAPPAAVEETKHIPISALLDERDKRKAAAAEAEELRRKLAEYEAKAQPKPDFFADPEAAIQAAQQAAMAAAINTKLETSRFLAEKDFGAELVAEAYAFFDQNPHLTQGFRNAPSPYHEAVATYRKMKAMQEIGDDPQAYRARIEEEVRQRLLAEMQAQPKPTAPPPSMAAAPGTGAGKAPTASGFDALFVRE